jgi:LysM repeat protein
MIILNYHRRHKKSVAYGIQPDKRGYNARMNKAGLRLSWMLLISFFVSGCYNAFLPTPDNTQTFSPPVNPYQVKSTTPEPTETIQELTPGKPVSPTPTPFKHEIQPGDTLYGLALKYNISLDRLVAANPGLDTSLLTIGTKVNIPFDDGDDFLIPAQTPYPIIIQQPQCYPSGDGGSWCLASLENDQNITLESVSAILDFYNGEKELIQSYIAIPPLDYYFRGQKMPVSVYIPPGLPKDFQVQASVVTAFPSERTKAKAEIIDTNIEYNEDKTIAEISGEVQPKGELVKENQIWIAAIAYHLGNPVGIRKWISDDKLIEDKNIPFQLNLYSLGPEIDKVALISELH